MRYAMQFCFIENMSVHMYFVSFIHSEILQVFEILAQERHYFI